MVYPILEIDANNNHLIHIYDTDFEDTPILSFGELSSKTPEVFYYLLSLFLNQHSYGYEEGYKEGYNDCFEDFDTY